MRKKITSSQIREPLERIVLIYFHFYLFADKSNNNNNNNNNRSILKSNYNLNTDIEEQNYYDRHHLIRFTGDSSQAINNNV